MIWETFETALETGADRPASIAAGRTRTWRETHARVLKLGARLRSEGVRPGERVALLALNSAAFLEATYAVAHAGALLVPLNLRLAPRELGAVLDDAEPRLLAFDPAFRALADDALQASKQATRAHTRLLNLDKTVATSASNLPPPVLRRADEPAHLYYTSGTTGRPKGVVLTHGNVVAHARNAIHELSLSPDDRWAHIAPMFHLADAWATIAVTAVGGAHAFLPHFEPQAALRLLEGQRISLTNLVPTMLNAMTHSPEADERDLSSLRLLLSGGAPIAPALVAAVERTFGCTYAQTYGLTETSPFLTISLLDARHSTLSDDARRAARARTGRPFRGVDVQVVSQTGEPVPSDDRTVGEVRARGATVTPGYWRMPAETAAAIRADWFYTGDLAVVDALGSLRIVDRKKDMVLTGAECVYSIEVEAVLYEHPDVLEAAVFGLPDERWGEVVNAAIVAKPGSNPEPEELRAFCRERLADYKVPKRIHLLNELPRTGSGKLAKRELRREFCDRGSAGDETLTADRAAPR